MLAAYHLLSPVYFSLNTVLIDENGLVGFQHAAYFYLPPTNIFHVGLTRVADHTSVRDFQLCVVVAVILITCIVVQFLLFLVYLVFQHLLNVRPLFTVKNNSRVFYF